MRTRTLCLALLTFLAALPAAAQHRRRSRDDEDRQKLDTTLTVSRGARIDLGLVSGTIKVTSWDKPQVQIHASTENGYIRFDASSSRISLSVEDQEGEEDAEFTIIVPKDADVETSAVSGDITVKGVAELDATNVSGDMNVVGVAGRATLQSVSGEVNASDLGGPVRAQSVSGDVTLQRIAGDINVQTVSSEMKLVGVKSSYVKTSTVSGDLEYEGALDPKGRYEFHSHSGGFSLTVPRATGAEVSFKGWSGELHSSCQMMLMPGDNGGGHYKTMTFRLGSGGAKVDIETFSGDVEIRGCGNTTSKEE